MANHDSTTVVLPFSQLPDEVFFVSLEPQNADFRVFIALDDSRLPKERRSKDGFGYAVFFIAKIEHFSGAPSRIWLQETSEIKGEDKVRGIILTTFFPFGAAISIIALRGYPESQASFALEADPHPVEVNGEGVTLLRVPSRDERRSRAIMRRMRAEEATAENMH